MAAKKKKKASKKKLPVPKKPTGRPRSVMTEKAEQLILTTVALGIWPDRAAMMHGISAATMRQHKGRHPSFVTALEKAEAAAEASFHSKIIRHTEKQWTAAAWMLERRWPERYAKRPETEITVTQQTAVMTGPPEPPTGALMDYVEKLAEVARSLKLPGGKAEVKVEIDQDQNGHGHSNGSNGTSNGAQ